jgi:hypothetical protein
MAVVPGSIPRLLEDPAVGLLRADERVFDAIGIRSQAHKFEA